MALIDNFKIYLQNNPGVTLTFKQLDRLREAMHRGGFSGAKLIKIVEVVELLDFNKNHISIYRILTNGILNYLLDTTDDDITNNTVDWVTEAKGNTLVTKLQASTLPGKVKKHILLEVEKHAVNILSANLLNAIALVKN